ncbi:unnamed protein product [Caenorhabditis angaria]|uniref:SXP/RAL-2 family protein Ani s 5-like cation-binding domain-containing protein n=1 Tax=Caenorhabditis angaria TaxID=860376 RepID=A0A9P1IFV4_9PELO|nr:unnamed protein product [Caenorhabditis angaria]
MWKISLLFILALSTCALSQTTVTLPKIVQAERTLVENLLVYIQTFLASQTSTFLQIYNEILKIVKTFSLNV